LYAVFHLIGTAHLWLICSTKDAPIVEQALYNGCILGDSDPAPAGQTSTMNNYADNFTKYMLQISMVSKFHQIHLFVTGSGDPLQIVDAQHHPRKQDVDTPSVEMTLTSAPLQATTQTHHDTSAKALLPRVVYHTRATTEPDDINNPIILNVSVLLAGSTSDANTHLLDIGNNTDVIIGTPWLTSHDRVTQYLTNIELQCVHNGQLFSFIATPHRHAPPTIRALMTPPSERATRATTLPPPRNILSPTSRDHHANTLNPTNTTDKISKHLRQATVQQ
jgi:hypothetical protein